MIRLAIAALRVLLRVPLLAFLAVVAWVLVTAATAETQQIANALVVFFTLVVLPLAVKYVKLDGGLVQTVNYVAALLFALAAGLLSGELHWNFSSAVQATIFITSLLGVQQYVFQLIKDHQGGPGPIPALGPLVK